MLISDVRDNFTRVVYFSDQVTDEARTELFILRKLLTELEPNYICTLG